jgi:hypothetical protein
VQDPVQDMTVLGIPHRHPFTFFFVDHLMSLHYFEQSFELWTDRIAQVRTASGAYTHDGDGHP